MVGLNSKFRSSTYIKKKLWIPHVWLKTARTHFWTLVANFGINKGPTNNQTSRLMVHLTLILAEHFLSSYWLIGEVLVSGWTYLPINMPLLGNVFSQSKAINLIVLEEYTPKGNLYIVT